jgi:hypothetical protein
MAISSATRHRKRKDGGKEDHLYRERGFDDHLITPCRSRDVDVQKRKRIKPAPEPVRGSAVVLDAPESACPKSSPPLPLPTPHAVAPNANAKCQRRITWPQ